MKSIIMLALAVVMLATEAANAGVTTNSTVVVPKVYCLPAAPAVPAGFYVSTGTVVPTANPTTTIEETDGVAFYVTSVGSTTGTLAPAVSCPQFYATKQ